MDNGFWQKVRRLMSVHSKRIHFESFLNPATADVDALVTNYTTSNAIQTFTVATFDGVGHTAGAFPYARNITMTLSSHADWNATTGVVTGLDINGATISEDFSIPNGGNTTLTGAKCFKSVSSIVIPAQESTGGTATFGFGALLGLSKKAMVRDGYLVHFLEILDGTQVTNGVWAIPATGLPNGSYAPNSAPNGSRDYVIGYELDVTAN